MSYILNKFRLMRLKCREWMLLAQAEHAAALMAQHQSDYAMLMTHLKRTRREIALRTAPDVLLNQVMRGKA